MDGTKKALGDIDAQNAERKSNKIPIKRRLTNQPKGS